MKYRTTRRDVMNGYYKVFSVGYCDLQNLLSRDSAVAYTCGVYGWNADIYDFGTYAICTGYRPFGVSAGHMFDDLEQKAKEIRNNYNLPYEVREAQIDDLKKEAKRRMVEYGRKEIEAERMTAQPEAMEAAADC